MPWRAALKVFLAALLIYNVNLRPVPTGDSLPNALLPIRVVLQGRFDFDEWQPFLASSYNGQAYFLKARQGHYYSIYPVAQPLLLTPLYTPLLLVPGLRELPMASLVLLARILEKVMASLIAAASVAGFYLLLQRLTSARRALLLSAVYAFATNTWSTSSQALWQHGASQLTIVLSLLCLAMFEARPSWRAAAGAGFFAALSVAMRPTDVLFVAASLAALLWFERRAVLLGWYAGFAALIGGAQVAYNFWLTGKAGGGYGSPALDGDFWSGLAGVILSPSHGLLIFSPVLLFAVVGAFCWRRESSVIFPIALFFCGAQVLVYANWPGWSGAECYGPRLMTDIAPAAVLLILPALDWMGRGRVRKIAFGAALGFSVVVQMIGVFAYPLGSRPPEPLWDWGHSPILMNAREGPVTAPYRVVAGWANDVLHGRRPDTAHTGLNVR